MSRRWTARRWWREYVRAYLDLLAIAERWLPPLRWHLDLYRTTVAVRRDLI